MWKVSGVGKLIAHVTVQISAGPRGSGSSSVLSKKAAERTYGMGAEYTPEQHAAVVRVMRLKVTDYYGILLLEKTCTTVEIKKAYRKQAIVVHPDKNKAPDADEAFKRVSKSFQVLSDDTKRRIFDQTGGDPETRAAAGGPGGNPFRNGGFGGGQRFQRTQFGGGDDIFNMFFGGPQAAGPQPQFQFHFGNPGSSFGAGPDIFSSFFGEAFGAPRAAPQPAPQQGTNKNVVFNILIIAALLLFSPLFSWITDLASTPLPSFRYESVGKFTEELHTPTYGVPFFVNPKESAGLSASAQKKLRVQAENQFVARTRAHCSNEYIARQEKMQAAMGWFSNDEEKLAEARAMPLPHCDLLHSFKIPLQQRSQAVMF